MIESLQKSFDQCSISCNPSSQLSRNGLLRHPLDYTQRLRCFVESACNVATTISSILDWVLVTVVVLKTGILVDSSPGKDLIVLTVVVLRALTTTRNVSDVERFGV